MTATSLKSPQFFSTFASNAKSTVVRRVSQSNVNYNTGSATTFLDRPKFNASTRTSKLRITDVSSPPLPGYRKAYYSKNLVNTNNKPPSPTGAPPAGAKRVLRSGNSYSSRPSIGTDEQNLSKEHKYDEHVQAIDKFSRAHSGSQREHAVARDNEQKPT